MGIPTRDIFKSESGFDPRKLIGSTLADRYVIEDLLGKGGMGAVYRATQLAIGRQVAIKIIIPSDSIPRTLEERFFREARIMSGLSNANIVQLYDFGESGPILFLVMELVEGELVSSLLKRGRFAPPLAREVARQVASGLIEAHSKGVVHRDLKPGNMLVGVGSDGRLRVKIFDFGIAYPRESEVKITKTGLMCGTPAYLAPEQIRGHEITERADLYGLGVCLFEMLTGKMPFKGATMEIMFKHVQEVPPSLTALSGGEIPPELGELVDQLLRKSPDERPDSALYVRDLLERQIDQPLTLDPDAVSPIDAYLLPPIDPSEAPRVRTPAPAPSPGSPPQEVSEPFKHASDEVKGAWAAFLDAAEQPDPTHHDVMDPNIENYEYTGPTGAFDPVPPTAETEWGTTNDWDPSDSVQHGADTEIDQGLEIDITSISNSMPKTADYQAVSAERPHQGQPVQETAQVTRPSIGEASSLELEESARRPRADHSADRTVQSKSGTVPRNVVFAILVFVVLAAVGGGLYWLQSTRFTPEEDTLSEEELEDYWQKQEEAERKAFEEAATRKSRQGNTKKTGTEPGDLKKKNRKATSDKKEVIDLWDGQDGDDSGSVKIERKK